VAPTEIADFLSILPAALRVPEGFWTTYDAEADVVYVNFKKPAQATDSELRDDDIIVRYDGAEIVGVTILHASRR
jgi:uncharacterized protein YuzE